MQPIINGLADNPTLRRGTFFRVIHHLGLLEPPPSLLLLFQVPRQGAKQSWAEEVPFLPLVLDGTFGR